MLKNRVNGLAVASAFESAGSAVCSAAIFRPSPMSEISKPTQVDTNTIVTTGAAVESTR